MKNVKTLQVKYRPAYKWDLQTYIIAKNISAMMNSKWTEEKLRVEGNIERLEHADLNS